jgi:hypothetical protein
MIGMILCRWDGLKLLIKNSYFGFLGFYNPKDLIEVVMIHV